MSIKCNPKKHTYETVAPCFCEAASCSNYSQYQSLRRELPWFILSIVRSYDDSLKRGIQAKKGDLAMIIAPIGFSSIPKPFDLLFKHTLGSDVAIKIS